MALTDAERQKRFREQRDARLRSYQMILELPGNVSIGSRGISTARAIGEITPIIDLLLKKAKTTGERKRIAEALLMEVNRVLEGLPK